MDTRASVNLRGILITQKGDMHVFNDMDALRVGSGVRQIRGRYRLSSRGGWTDAYDGNAFRSRVSIGKMAVRVNAKDVCAAGGEKNLK